MTLNDVKDKVFGYYKPSTDIMVLCVKNHGTDYAELGDTLRHESIHVAQACNGGPILTWNQIAKYSNNRILSIVQRYPADHQHYEYEAFTAAALMNNQQVAKDRQRFLFLISALRDTRLYLAPFLQGFPALFTLWGF